VDLPPDSALPLPFGGSAKITSAFGGIGRHGGWVSAVGWAALISTAYFLASRLGLSLLVPPSDVAVFWPAAGIGAGILIAFGRRALPPLAIAVMVGTVAANLLSAATSALGGAAVITLLHTTAPFWDTWLVWLLSDGVGMVVVAPLIIEVRRALVEPPSRRDILMVPRCSSFWAHWQPSCIPTQLRHAFHLSQRRSSFLCCYG